MAIAGMILGIVAVILGLIPVAGALVSFPSISDETREVLLRVAQEGEHSPDKVAQVLRLAATTHEFQRA